MVGTRLEKVWQAWRRVKPCLWRGLRWSLVGLLVAGVILALIYVPKMQVPVCPPGQEGLPPKICFDIENEARRTLAYILAGILAIFGIYMAHRRIRALERQVQIGQEQLQVAQEGQITERFTRAIEQLGSPEMAIRLGGIYALERIANDSDKDYWPIMETLTAYVRERAPWRGPHPHFRDTVSEEVSASLMKKFEIKPSTDIQAVLTVLGRRKFWYGKGEDEPLDLSNTNLRGADLSNADLRVGLLSGANLEEANLNFANLNGTTLIGANLKRADLFAAQMARAYMDNAQMEYANLISADLEWALLRNANLEMADLELATLEKTSLEGAHLEGANLRKAIGLTWEQLTMAILDDKTQLPDYLQEQLPGLSGSDRDSE